MTRLLRSLEKASMTSARRASPAEDDLRALVRSAYLTPTCRQLAPTTEEKISMSAQILIEAARAVVADPCEMNLRRLGYAIEQAEQPEPVWLTELVERARLLRRHHQDFGTCLVIAALAGRGGDRWVKEHLS
jgi:hypothetical protein